MSPSPASSLVTARTLGLIAAFVSAAAYGFNVPYARLASDMGVNGPDLVFYRVFAMLVVVLAAAWLLRRRLAVARQHTGLLLAIGLSSAIIGIAYLSSVAFVPVGVAVIIFYTYPLLILIASPLVDGEKLTGARLAIFALAFAGLVIAIGPGLGLYDWRGLALAALAALATATQFFLGARAGSRVDPIALLFWIHVIVLPLALAVALVFGGPASPTVLWLALGPVAANIVAYVFAFFLHMRAVALAPPAAVGLVFTLEPVVSIVTAAFVLDERLTQAQLIGGVLVLAALVGAVLLEMRRSPKASS
jgi:drug/metabolite transporter (DMT)-like permease